MVQPATPPSFEEREARFEDLVRFLQSIPPSIFDPFEVHRAHYPSSGGLIGVDVISPKSFKSLGTRPVIVRIHGGFFVTGSSLFPAWFSKWILDYAEMHGAVIISPNYRLLPEVKGRDILDDMQAFWGWLRDGGAQRHFHTLGRFDVSLDVRRLLLIGESAGGYLALQSVLSQFVHPKALLMLYPMLDLRSDYFNKPFEKPICGVPNMPDETIDNFLATSSGNASITEADPPSRLREALATVQTGRLLELMGDDPELFVLERIRSGKLPPRREGEPLLPPLFILHGENDSAVPIDGTLKLLKYLEEDEGGQGARTRVHAAIRPGDHGFDASATPNDGWLKDGLDFVRAEWLGGDPQSQI